MLKKYQNPEGGLNKAGVEFFRKENPGSKLKMGVDKKPETDEEKRRQGSFLTRFYGRSEIPPLQDDKGRPTRYALAANAWNSKVPKTNEDVRKLYKKGLKLLEQLKNKKGKQ